MDNQSIIDAARLRQKAAHCRNLAVSAVSMGVARELESMALEYETSAEKLELGIQ